MIQYRKSIDAMETIYSTAKICSFTNPADCGLSLDPGKLFNVAFINDSQPLKKPMLILTY